MSTKSDNVDTQGSIHRKRVLAAETGKLKAGKKMGQEVSIKKGSNRGGGGKSEIFWKKFRAVTISMALWGMVIIATYNYFLVEPYFESLRRFWGLLSVAAAALGSVSVGFGMYAVFKVSDSRSLIVKLLSPFWVWIAGTFLRTAILITLPILVSFVLLHFGYCSVHLVTANGSKNLDVPNPLKIIDLEYTISLEFDKNKSIKVWLPFWVENTIQCIYENDTEGYPATPDNKTGNFNCPNRRVACCEKKFKKTGIPLKWSSALMDSMGEYCKNLSNSGDESSILDLTKFELENQNSVLNSSIISNIRECLREPNSSLLVKRSIQVSISPSAGAALPKIEKVKIGELSCTPNNDGKCTIDIDFNTQSRIVDSNGQPLNEVSLDVYTKGDTLLYSKPIIPGAVIKSGSVNVSIPLKETRITIVSGINTLPPQLCKDDRNWINTQVTALYQGNFSTFDRNVKFLVNENGSVEPFGIANKNKLSKCSNKQNESTSMSLHRNVGRSCIATLTNKLECQ